MKIVILGASGQIGSTIFNGLRKHPEYEVVGTSRKASEDYLQFDPFQNDWSPLGKVDVLINCVGQIEATPSSSFYRIHVELTKRILQYRSEMGMPRIIQISALGASRKHQVEFLRTKGIADDCLLEYPDTAVIRPSIVCTPRTMIVKKMLMLSRLSRFSLGMVAVPKGFLHTRIQPIMPRDLVDIVQRILMGSHPRIINAVGPQAITFRALLELMTTACQHNFRILELPKSFVDVAVRGIVSQFFPNVINWQQYRLLFEDNIADPTEVESLLGRPLNSARSFFLNEFSEKTNRIPGTVFNSQLLK